MLYIYLGSETFVDAQNNGGPPNGSVTVGYSNLYLPSLWTRVIGLINAR